MININIWQERERRPSNAILARSSEEVVMVDTA
jgi:hypothetical protein